MPARCGRLFRVRTGAAGAWWPIRSSKPAGRGSPTLGRFDSFAAPFLQMAGFCRVRWSASVARRRYVSRITPGPNPGIASVPDLDLEHHDQHADEHAHADRED